MRQDSVLAPLLDQFVCVRLVQMKGVDLGQLKFDFDLKWAALLVNADGTVYARYGSGGHGGADASSSIAGFRATLERVLAAHRDYPANRAAFAKKRGRAPAHRFIRAYPMPGVQRILRAPTSRKNCIHCHNVYAAMSDLAERGPDYDPDTMWKHPPTSGLGFELEPTAPDRVRAVRASTPAHAAGLRVGDRIRSIDEQSIDSIADARFALHEVTGDRVTLRVERDDAAIDVTIPLPKGWRRSDLSWRGSMWHMPPRPRIWTQRVSEGERRRLGLPADRMAIRVRGVFGGAGRRAGLKKGDIIVGYDGRTDDLSSSGWHADLRLRHYRPGAKVRLKIRRGARELDVTLAFP